MSDSLKLYNINITNQRLPTVLLSTQEDAKGSSKEHSDHQIAMVIFDT